MADAPVPLRSEPDILPGFIAHSFALTHTDGLIPRERADIAVISHWADDGVACAGNALQAGRASDAGEAPERSKQPERPKRAIVYLPGFADYFFHTHLEQAYREAGWAFYALDFRRSGRALRDPADRDVFASLALRDEEINLAVDYARARGASTVMVMGHSTGGLQAVTWAARNPGRAQGLILNSPWLEMDFSTVTRRVLTPLIRRLAEWRPLTQVSTLGQAYPRSIHFSCGGEWDFDPALKPLTEVPVRAATVAAVRAGQEEVEAGLNVKIPILLACARYSSSPNNPSARDLESTDCVLEVEWMLARARNLGRETEFLRIENGRHDLALSIPSARQHYIRETLAWANAHA